LAAVVRGHHRSPVDIAALTAVVAIAKNGCGMLDFAAQYEAFQRRNPALDGGGVRAGQDDGD
jgi:hypothetical protein